MEIETKGNMNEGIVTVKETNIVIEYKMDGINLCGVWLPFPRSGGGRGVGGFSRYGARILAELMAEARRKWTRKLVRQNVRSLLDKVEIKIQEREDQDLIMLIA